MRGFTHIQGSTNDQIIRPSELASPAGSSHLLGWEDFRTSMIAAKTAAEVAPSANSPTTRVATAMLSDWPRLSQSRGSGSSHIATATPTRISPTTIPINLFILGRLYRGSPQFTFRSIRTSDSSLRRSCLPPKAAPHVGPSPLSSTPRHSRR